MVAQINTDENPVLARRFAIRGIPAFHLLRKGKSVATISGASDLESLVAWFKSHVV